MKNKITDTKDFVLFCLVVVAFILLATVGVKLYINTANESVLLYEADSPQQTVYSYLLKDMNNLEVNKQYEITSVEELDKSNYLLRKYGGKELLMNENLTEDDISVVLAKINIIDKVHNNDITELTRRFYLIKKEAWSIYQESEKYNNTFDTIYEVAEDSCNELIKLPEVNSIFINDIQELNKNMYPNELNYIKLYSKNEITNDKLSVLLVDYSIKYNNAKTGLKSGHYKQLKYLIREDDFSEWQVTYSTIPQKYQLLSAEDTVTQYLLNMKNDPSNYVKSFKLDKVTKAAKSEIEHYVKMWKNTTKWRVYEVQEGHATIIDAYYDVQYDNTKTFMDSGYIKHRMYLVRRDENNPWIILDQMSHETNKEK